MTITKESLKSYHTKQLLSALRKCCVNQQQLDEWYGPIPEYNDIENVRVREALLQMREDFGKYRDKPTYEQTRIVDAHCFGLDDCVGSTITIAELKQELATREHVLNKIEAKELRRAKARAKKNR